MMTKIKTLLYLTIFLGLIPAIKAQEKSINLEKCYELARQNYPAIKQLNLVQKSAAYTIENTNKLFLPQFSVNGQATYQSDVTKFPLSLPGLKVESVAKDQYKIYGEVNQGLTDLITLKQSREIQKANAAIEQQNIEVQLYQIKEKVSQLYFGILLLEARIEQSQVLNKELSTLSNTLSTAIKNGIKSNSSEYELEIEKIKLDQRMIELLSAKKSYITMLAMFTNLNLTDNTEFIHPNKSYVQADLARPEMELFSLQNKQLLLQSEMVNIKNIPRLGLFFQGGYGRPGLNFLSNQFDSYYITGIRLNWNIAGFYTQKKERKIIEVKQDMIQSQKETFEFNNQIQVNQELEELEKTKLLLSGDNTLIELQEKLLKSAKVRLENGEISSSTYLSSLNDLDQARINKSIHEIQAMLITNKLFIITGN